MHAGYAKTDIAGMGPEEQLKEISAQTHELVRSQYSTLNRSLLPALEKVGTSSGDGAREIKRRTAGVCGPLFRG